eukprot:5128789-Prymnesium_polylepis.2
MEAAAHRTQRQHVTHPPAERHARRTPGSEQHVPGRDGEVHLGPSPRRVARRPQMRIGALDEVSHVRCHLRCDCCRCVARLLCGKLSLARVVVVVVEHWSSLIVLRVVEKVVVAVFVSTRTHAVCVFWLAPAR